MVKTLLCVWVLSCGQALPPDEKPDAPPPEFNDLLEQSKKLGDGDWGGNAQLEMQAVQRVFARNGWNSPEDQFAMQVVQRVNAIPPWNQADRQNAFLDAVTERYKFTADQRRKINTMMQRETLRFAINHFKEVAPIAMEVMKARAAGEPFTPEQIARWSKAAGPLMDEAREAFERTTRELSKDLTDEQREILKRDVAAVLKRHRGIARQLGRWENGEWRPEDWGLDADPIQNGTKLQTSSTAVNAPAAGAPRGADPDKATAVQTMIANARPAGEGPLNENEWERYVREFCDRNNFSEDQRKSAQSVLRDLLARAREWRTASGPRIEEARAKLNKAKDPAAQAKLREELDKLEKPLGRMFDELKRRLDALLTAQQRKAARK